MHSHSVLLSNFFGGYFANYYQSVKPSRPVLFSILHPSLSLSCIYIYTYISYIHMICPLYSHYIPIIYPSYPYFWLVTSCSIAWTPQSKKTPWRSLWRLSVNSSFWYKPARRPAGGSRLSCHVWRSKRGDTVTMIILWSMRRFPKIGLAQVRWMVFGSGTSHPFKMVGWYLGGTPMTKNGHLHGRTTDDGHPTGWPMTRGNPPQLRLQEFCRWNLMTYHDSSRYCYDLYV